MRRNKHNETKQTTTWVTRNASRLVLSGALLGIAVPLLSYETFPGSPRWGRGTDNFHYVTDLRPGSFPSGGVWDRNAQSSLSDWRDIGDTSFTPGFSRTNSNPENHLNFRNTWWWTNRPNDTWLGVTHVRYSTVTNRMYDCDVWFNSRGDYSWTGDLSDPCAPHPYWPISFRGVARHETGHAIGFAHENDVLANMNAIYQHGNSIGHGSSTGMMPHGDDKAGCRSLYRASETVRNVMATCWREPDPTDPARGARRLSITGTWAAGATRSVPVYLENQGNVALPLGATGVRAGIYLSTNNIISTADTRIAEDPFNGGWGAHGQFYFDLNARVPTDMPAGSYYVGVLFDNTGVVTEQFENDNAAVIGRVTVQNSTHTLIVTSRNPPSGTQITVSPSDRNGAGSGTTPMSRSYWNGTNVTLTAPPLAGINPFRYWLVNGNNIRTSRVTTVSMTRGVTASAVYSIRARGIEREFGQPGCPGSTGVAPQHTVTHGNGVLRGNQQGTPSYYDLSGTQPGSLVALYLGLRTDRWGQLVLPLDLTFLGMPGCFLNHDIVVGLTTGPTQSPRGQWRETITWPVNAQAVGTSVYSTYAVVDPGANALGVVHTNSIQLIQGGIRP